MGTFFQGRDALQKHTQPSLLAPFPTAFKCHQRITRRRQRSGAGGLTWGLHSEESPASVTLLTAEFLEEAEDRGCNQSTFHWDFRR